jgi:hypothetical protein
MLATPNPPPFKRITTQNNENQHYNGTQRYNKNKTASINDTQH